MKHYIGLRRGEIVGRIESALRDGGEVIKSGDPTMAPFQFTISRSPTDFRSCPQAVT
jgi:hypothetical protein